MRASDASVAAAAAVTDAAVDVSLAAAADGVAGEGIARSSEEDPEEAGGVLVLRELADGLGEKQRPVDA